MAKEENIAFLRAFIKKLHVVPNANLLEMSKTYKKYLK